MNPTPRLPDSFRRIDLELAREPLHPLGDQSDRYVLIVPIGPDGKLDAALWRDHPEACRVVRGHDGEIATGKLVHGPGRQWRIVYDDADQPEETGYRFHDECLVVGEYLSIIRDGTEHPYRITGVTKL